MVEAEQSHTGQYETGSLESNEGPLAKKTHKTELH